MQTTTTTLYFDLNKIQAVRQTYEDHLEFLAGELPADLNPLSPKNIKEYYKNWFDLPLKSGRISDIEELFDTLDPDEEVAEITYMLLQYLKGYYLLKNYVYPIINHNGAVPLRLYNGKTVFPNRQPIPTCPDIQACYTGEGEER